MENKRTFVVGYKSALWHLPTRGRYLLRFGYDVMEVFMSGGAG